MPQRIRRHLRKAPRPRRRPPGHQPPRHAPGSDSLKPKGEQGLVSRRVEPAPRNHRHSPGLAVLLAVLFQWATQPAKVPGQARELSGFEQMLVSMGLAEAPTPVKTCPHPATPTPRSGWMCTPRFTTVRALIYTAKLPTENTLRSWTHSATISSHPHLKPAIEHAVSNSKIKWPPRLRRPFS